MTNQSTNITPDGGANNQPTVNERLDEVLSAVYLAGTENGLGRTLTNAEEIMHRKEAFIKGNNASEEAKQAINSLTKELVAEAKPEDLDPFYGKPTADEYEQNILKALEQL